MVEELEGQADRREISYDGLVGVFERLREVESMLGTNPDQSRIAMAKSKVVDYGVQALVMVKAYRALQGYEQRDVTPGMVKRKLRKLENVVGISRKEILSRAIGIYDCFRITKSRRQTN